jgi:TRAP transporter TAXI family solute receptor
MRVRPLILAAVLAAGQLAGCVAVSVVLAPPPLSLATGTAGGDYHPVGNAVCRMYNLAGAHEARPCVAVSSAGSVDNIRRIGRGASVFALAQADVAHAAYRGEGPFASAGADGRLRALIALHPEAFTVVARADAGIGNFRDLRGKRVGVGSSGAGYPFTRDAVLRAHAWTIAELGPVLELAPEEQEQALCGNLVDAVFFVAGHPNGVTQGVTAGCRAKVVSVAGEPVDRLVATHPWYFATSIPAGMYAGNPDAVPTFGTRAVLLASADLPDEVAYAVVQAVIENFADFRRLHPVLSPLTPKGLVPVGAMPIHPGALDYYRKAGLVP